MIKYLSLFSGIGAFEKALTNLHIPFELVGYSEIDKYASKAYSLIHKVPESMNLGDITQIDESILPQVDLITYGFPCQDISLAGLQKGLFNTDGTKTRRKNGLMGKCDIIPKSEAKPGDLIFFQKTYNTRGASHVGIYVGNGMMIHCGNPISYASIETNYWRQHYYCMGRIR